MIYKLSEYPNDLERGFILRCKGKYPYESVVDFMICESYETGKGFVLYVISGYKAGLRFVVLPQESVPGGNTGHAISRKWLMDNWNNWGYADCPIKDVLVVINNMPN